MKPQVKKILFHFLIVSLFSLIVFLVVSAILDDKNSSSNIFAITWKNYDGTIIYQEELEKGSMPQYSGNTPKRISDSNADYYFSGWIPSIQEVSSDITYVAEYVLDYKGTGLVSSHESGFYDGEFDLSLYSADNTTIYYTLDSTTPTTNSKIYDSPIKIEDNSDQPNVFANISGISANDVYIPNHLVDKCVVLKFVAVNDEGVSSDVVTKTFFINYNKKNGYDNLPIISMIVEYDDLFDYETGIYVTGKVYDESEHKGYPEQYPANYNQKGREWERKANFLYFDEDKSFSFDQTIGIRIHGGWSRIFNQKSFNLYARKEYSGSNSFEKPFFDTTKLQTCMLRSGGYRNIYSTKTRDVLNQELSKNESFATQDGYPCILFLNGEYWGYIFFKSDLLIIMLKNTTE